jgi:hypothetical protein
VEGYREETRVEKEGASEGQQGAVTRAFSVFEQQLPQ